MNVDTQEFLCLRGQVSGLTVAVGELRRSQVALAADSRRTWRQLTGLAAEILPGLGRLGAAVDQLAATGRHAAPGAPLRVLAGGGRGGQAGRHTRPRLVLAGTVVPPGATPGAPGRQ